MSVLYLERLADTVLDDKLSYMSAVLIRGVKWCGKTSTAARQAKSILYMQDPDTANQNIEMAGIRPSNLLLGEKPRLLDEWQTAPVLWDSVRFAVDQDNANGQFILTGSATPSNDAVMHTGTGRIARMTMRTMSLFESLESTNEVSLANLFESPESIGGYSNLTVNDYAYLIARGGWPKAVVDSTSNKSWGLQTAKECFLSIIESDISRVDDIKRNPRYARSLLKSLARNTSTQANLKTIRADMESDGVTISDKTVASYVNSLRRIFILDEISAWSPKMRSKTALRSSPTWHLVDPSLAVAALDADPDRLLGDLSTMGLLFESLCVRDLRVYASMIDGDILHFRDRTGLEVDAIVQLNNGRWGAVEIKLGSTKAVEEAAANLFKLRNRIDTSAVSEPEFLMVLTGGQYAYRREDGIYVVPLGCLCP